MRWSKAPTLSSSWSLASFNPSSLPPSSWAVWADKQKKDRATHQQLKREEQEEEVEAERKQQQQQQQQQREQQDKEEEEGREEEVVAGDIGWQQQQQQQQQQRRPLTPSTRLTRQLSIHLPSTPLSLPPSLPSSPFSASAEHLTRTEANLLRGVLQISNKTVADCMLPWEKVVCLSTEAPLDEFTLRAIGEAGFSRIPVCRPQEGKEEEEEQQVCVCGRREG